MRYIKFNNIHLGFLILTLVFISTLAFIYVNFGSDDWAVGILILTFGIVDFIIFLFVVLSLIFTDSEYKFEIKIPIGKEKPSEEWKKEFEEYLKQRDK